MTIEDGVEVKYCARKRHSGKLRWLEMAWQGLAAVPRALRMNEVYIPYLGMAFWWCFTWTGCLGERNSAFLLERAKHLQCDCKANCSVTACPEDGAGTIPLGTVEASLVSSMSLVSWQMRIFKINQLKIPGNVVLVFVLEV